MTAPSIAQFHKIVWNHYKQYGRHDLPWRKTRDRYKILVSEVMLQQTQVERVMPFYMAWLKQFPTVQALAEAPLSAVLRAWQGLGYNRRAKMLHGAAKTVVKEYGGKMPKSAETLDALPGVGPYTARAIMAFAENEDDIFIETNLRTAVMHHFFADHPEKVSDADILEILKRALPSGKAREWYWALMDYGAHLKRSGVRINAKSKSYVKQKQFLGSSRQARGAILKALATAPRPAAYLNGMLGPDRKELVSAQLAALLKEGLVARKAGKYQLPD